MQQAVTLETGYYEQEAAERDTESYLETRRDKMTPVSRDKPPWKVLVQRLSSY